MTFRWISGFSSRAQLKCFLIKSGNLTTRFCAFGVLACLKGTLSRVDMRSSIPSLRDLSRSTAIMEISVS